jgi:crotonobetainyl-CoA:carnitine CoA-transferase CaiB-like acyl-CoA transferase
MEVADGWIAIDTNDALAPDATGLADRSTADLLGELSERGVPATQVRLDQMEAFFDDPATWSSGLAARYSHPQWGQVEQVGSMWHFGDLTTRFACASPLIGQHTVEILTELGFEDWAIDSLLATGAAATSKAIPNSA